MIMTAAKIILILQHFIKLFSKVVIFAGISDDSPSSLAGGLDSVMLKIFVNYDSRYVNQQLEAQ